MNPIQEQLAHTLKGTDFEGLGERYVGKVRDVYQQEDRLIIVTTDRVSAFDHVLGTIPFKGEILNRMAVDAFRATEDIAKNHLIDVPDPNVVVAKKLKAYPVEMIVRQYITGSLWRDYLSGVADAYALDFAKGLKKDQRFDAPIFTPSTKAEIGTHDEPISKADIVTRGLMTSDQLERAEATARKLFARGAERAAARGLILVDTKYELGEDEDGELYVIDEIHTPDSSRYWIASEYEERFAAGEPQRMLDKENLRGWLIDKHGFSGHGTPPALDDDIRTTLAARYFDAYAAILGAPFEPTVGDVGARIRKNLERAHLLPSPS